MWFLIPCFISMNSMGDIDNQQTPKKEIGHLQRISTTNSLVLFWKNIMETFVTRASRGFASSFAKY